MKKFARITAGLALSMGLLSSTAFAATNPYSWNEPGTGDWALSKPYRGTFQMIWMPTPGEFQAALTNVKWNSASVTAHRTSDYYPTLDIRDDSPSDKAITGTYGYSDLPDPKIDLEDDNIFGDGVYEELEVVSRGKFYMEAEKPYKFETYWRVLNHNYNDYMIAYSSLSMSNPTGGDYNTIGNSVKPLAGIYKNDILSNGFAANLSTPVSKTNQEPVSTQQTQTEKPSTKRVSLYDNIKTKADLDSFKEQSEKIFTEKVAKKESLGKSANQDENQKVEEENFVITFNYAISLEALKEKLAKVNINDVSVYARGFENGLRTTAFTKSLEDGIWEQIKSKPGYQGVIQLEGKASIEDLKRLKADKDIYSLEIASNDYFPMGLYWKLEDTKKQ